MNIDLQDEAGAVAEISEARSTWEENCDDEVVCLCWQASKPKTKRRSKAWHVVVVTSYFGLPCSSVHYAIGSEAC